MGAWGGGNPPLAPSPRRGTPQPYPNFWKLKKGGYALSGGVCLPAYFGERRGVNASREGVPLSLYETREGRTPFLGGY